jgi:hypothetical protein
MALTSDDIKAQMVAVQYEPTRTISIMATQLESAFNGENLLVDASNPFVQLLEAQVILTAGAIDENRLLNNQQYPVMAASEEDLNANLSDKEYEGMFGSPAGCWFDIWMSEEEILTFAVKVGTTGTKKLTIPRHTRITVQGKIFTFQYPINYIVKKHGSVDVVYDGTQTSPLQVLAGNKVDWGTYTTRVVTDNNAGAIRMIRVRTFLKQMKNTSYKYSLTGAKTLKKVLALDSDYYYTRAFRRPPGGQWTEIKTTHSLQVFDAQDPTLLLKVIDDTLTIELPYVYFATSLVRGDLRVDVYTCDGPIEMDISTLPADNFVGEYIDLDESDNLIYSAPLSSMSTISIGGDEITGGVTRPSFDVRRQRMLTNSVGDSVIPISPAQMNTTLADLGFDSKMVVDMVTERTYLASRAMPNNASGRSTAGIDAAVLTAKYAIRDLVGLETVIVNGDHYTVLPKTLFRNVDGVLQIVSDDDRKALELMTGDGFVNTISGNGYLYTPLHYVLDISNNEFQARPYYLTSPTFDVTSFVASNDTLGLTASTSSTRSIIKNENGYVIQIKSSSNQAWQALNDDQVHVQLAFKPVGESNYAYVNGVQVAKSGERIFQFQINTNWDLSKDHQLTTTNFNMFEPIERDYPTPLQNDFSLIWSVSNYTVDGAERTEVDDVIGDFLLPAGSIGLYHELITVKLGDSLGIDDDINYGLWTRARGMVGEAKYITYPADVYATYDRNIYDKDAEGKPIIVDDGNGNKSLKIKYPKGSFILDGDGNKTILYHKGQVIINPETGEATVETGRSVMRWWDMCLFDAVYRYATYAPDKTYADAVPKVLATWINETLAGVASLCLEETDILFQPRNTLKYVECLVDDSEKKVLLTAQDLVLTFFVTAEVYKDADLRASLEATGKEQILVGLDSTVVARDGLVDLVRNNVGIDAVGIKLTGLGGRDNDFDVITLLDESSRLCLAKAMQAQPDGTYAVVDGIEVNFKRHSDQD